MLHNMKLQNEPFEQIKQGVKDVELRLFDEKRQKINAGDVIVFKNILTSEEITTKCIDVFKAPSFYELFKMLNDNSRMGFSENLSCEEMSEKMRKYYSVSDEQKYGVVGILIKLV